MDINKSIKGTSSSVKSIALRIKNVFFKFTPNFLIIRTSLLANTFTVKGNRQECCLK